MFRMQGGLVQIPPYPMTMVNIICWNVRGLNNPNKQRDVALFYRENKGGLCVLVETKIKKECETEKLSSMFIGWKTFVNHDSHHYARICFLWDDSLFLVDIMNETDQVVHSRVTIKRTGQVFHFSAVYGFNIKERRLPLRRDLKEWNTGNNKSP